MLQNASSKLFVLELGERINSAVEKALGRHPSEAYEPVAISDDGRDLSLVSVDLLLHTQSRILELANEEKNKLLEEIRNSERNLRRTLAQLEQMQHQLIESEKMAALGQLVAGVAHEINTPIGIALTAISYLGEQTTEFSETYRNGRMKKSSLESYIATAHESSELVRMNISRAAVLISSFKQVAVDQTSENLRDFQMREFLTELLTSLNPEFKRSRHAVVLECPDDLKVRSYPGALSQVVTNLIGNAIRHAFADDQPGTIRLEILPGEAEVVVTVSDDGLGIPDEILPRIFEPFFTTKRGSGGTGLGLHIVYNLIHEKLRGQIAVKSKVGSGTRFAVTMPRMLPEVEVRE
jgi:signal transduction histidine kinase